MLAVIKCRSAVQLAADEMDRVFSPVRLVNVCVALFQWPLARLVVDVGMYLCRQVGFFLSCLSGVDGDEAVGAGKKEGGSKFVRFAVRGKVIWVFFRAVEAFFCHASVTRRIPRNGDVRSSLGIFLLQNRARWIDSCLPNLAV